MPTKPLEKEQDWDRAHVHAMHKAYLGGATLRELGKANGVSYERIRQLFGDEGLPTERAKRQTVARYAHEVAAWQRKEEIWELYREHGTVEAVVEKTEIPRLYVARVIADMPLRQVYRRKGENKSYERSQIVESLRAAAKVCGEPLTIPAYRKEAPKQGWPADLTVIRAFGTWEDACKASRVKANPSEGPRKGSYTADDCISAVRICAAELDHVPNYEQYVQWARANRQPSGATVRVKVGPWREALKLAFG